MEYSCVVISYFWRCMMSLEGGKDKTLEMINHELVALKNEMTRVTKFPDHNDPDKIERVQSLYDVILAIKNEYRANILDAQGVDKAIKTELESRGMNAWQHVPEDAFSASASESKKGGR